MKILLSALLLASASIAQEVASPLPVKNECRVGVPSGIGKDGAAQSPCFSPSEAIAGITFTDRAVPRLRYAIELRDELRKRGRLCDHAEDWDATIRAIAEGAELIEMAVCHHEKKTRRTLYRVAARWMTEREYPEASVLEGVERRR